MGTRDPGPETETSTDMEGFTWGATLLCGSAESCRCVSTAAQQHG